MARNELFRLNKLPGAKDDSDNVYMNLLVSNNFTPDGGYELKRAEYLEERQIPIIERASDYYLSIIRFTVPTGNVPLFVFNIEEGQTQNDIDLGVYKVCLEDGPGNISTEIVRFLPTRNDVPFPQPPSANPPYYTQAESPYYYVYDINKMLEMINNALAAALSGLPPVVGRESPYFIYEPESFRISLVAQNDWYNEDIPGFVKVWFNIPMMRFLQGFPMSIWSYENNPDGRNFYIRIKGTPFNTINPPSTFPAAAPEWIKITQEQPSLSGWNDITGLVFTTNRIPVSSEAVPVTTNPSVFSTVNSEGIANFRPIVTDFELFLSDTENLRTVVQYTPNGPYRLVDLLSQAPIRAIDVQVWWQDRSAKLHPLFIQKGQHMTIKILFVRKTSTAAKMT